jgi:hypothetical protein
MVLTARSLRGRVLGSPLPVRWPPGRILLPLRAPVEAGPVPGMFDLDEGLARTDLVGAIAHAVIADLAALSRAPDLPLMQKRIGDHLHRFGQMESRAHRQNLCGVVQRYFRRCLPPEIYVFGGSEYDLGIGRADLVWFDPLGRVLVDELKTGSSRRLELSSTAEQVERYRRACVSAWGEKFQGLRVLSPVEPSRSRLITPDGTALTLNTTPYLQRS